MGLDFLAGVRIGVDIDGCLTDHDLSFCRHYTALTGKPLLPADLTPDWFANPSHEQQVIKAAIFHDAAYWIGLPAAAHAGAVLTTLMGWGARVTLFTARALDKRWMDDHTSQRAEFWRTLLRYVGEGMGAASWGMGDWMELLTREWLRRESIPYDVLVMDGCGARGKTRQQLCESGAFDVFIDDNPVNVLAISNLAVEVLMPDHHYNRRVMGPFVQRVGLWHDDCLAPQLWDAIGTYMINRFAPVGDVEITAVSELMAVTA